MCAKCLATGLAHGKCSIDSHRRWVSLWLVWLPFLPPWGWAALPSKCIRSPGMPTCLSAARLDQAMIEPLLSTSISFWTVFCFHPFWPIPYSSQSTLLKFSFIRSYDSPAEKRPLQLEESPFFHSTSWPPWPPVCLFSHTSHPTLRGCLWLSHLAGLSLSSVFLALVLSHLLFPCQESSVPGICMLLSSSYWIISSSAIPLRGIAWHFAKLQIQMYEVVDIWPFLT